MDPKLSLSWDSYQKSICNGLRLLQQRSEFVDMTLAADGHHVKVHQMVLSLVSPFIKDLLASASCPHPVIFLNRVSYPTLQAILEYAYTGEVLVARECLYEFLEACKDLHIKGLEDDSIKASADGALMRLVEDVIEIKPTPVVAPTPTTTPTPASLAQADQLVKTGVKRRKTGIVEEEEPEHVYEDFTMEETHISDDALDDYEVETRKEDIDKNEKYAQAKQKQDSAGSVVQYSLSCQGSVQVILNRFIYRLRHPRKNNEKMYRCAEYNKKGCPAYVVTKGDIVLERAYAHNHPFHDKQILKRVRNGNVYTQYKAAETVASMNKKIAPAGKKDDESGED